jgi:hypothetical protein
LTIFGVFAASGYDSPSASFSLTLSGEAKMLKFTISLSMCMLCCVATAVSGVDTDSEKVGMAWGIWADQEQTNVYAFLENNDFKFRHRRQGKPSTLEGAWKTALGACWSDKNREQTGNVLIYVNTTQCCMTAEFLGSNLVLTYLWDKPAGGASPDPDRFCQNRVLRRLPSMPSN